MEEKVIIAYDGDCLMCSRGIRFLAEHDRHRRLGFLKLQSARGREMEKESGESRLSTMLAGADGQIYSRSDAVLRCLRAMGGFWAFLGALGRFFPGRNALYDWIARRRHRWFKNSTCSLPSPELTSRLIDGDRV